MTVLKKVPDLPPNQIEFLSSQTDYSEEEIKQILIKFHENNPDGLLDKDEFLLLYSQIKPESLEYLQEISPYIFRTFDGNDDGVINFTEFLVNLNN